MDTVLIALGALICIAAAIDTIAAFRRAHRRRVALDRALERWWADRYPLRRPDDR